MSGSGWVITSTWMCRSLRPFLYSYMYSCHFLLYSASVKSILPVLLPRKSHGQRSLLGCSPWGREESDTTRWLHCHFSLSCIKEGNGNPLQCSCLENPKEGEAWWAAVSGFAQSQTPLKRLSSSSDFIVILLFNPHNSLKYSIDIGA